MACFNMGLVARKSVFVACEQQSCRPACALVEAGLLFRYLLSIYIVWCYTYGTWNFKIQIIKVGSRIFRQGWEVFMCVCVCGGVQDHKI